MAQMRFAAASSFQIALGFKLSAQKWRAQRDLLNLQQVTSHYVVSVGVLRKTCWWRLCTKAWTECLHLCNAEALAVLRHAAVKLRCRGGSALIGTGESQVRGRAWLTHGNVGCFEDEVSATARQFEEAERCLAQLASAALIVTCRRSCLIPARRVSSLQ